MPQPSRVVSLLPSATEIVYALGAADRLVGVTYECDHPADARTDNAVVVGGADTSGMTPAEIDARVRAMAAAGEDLYTLQEGALRGLQPDLVLTQDLCRVCALPSDVVDDALAHLGCSADVVALDPASLDDVVLSVLDVARALDVVPAGEELVAALRARLDRVAATVAGRPRPRVAVLEWVDPPFTAGHWVPDLVVAAGGQEVLGAPGARSVTTTWDEAVAARPDVVLVAPCGYHLDGAVEQGGAVVTELARRGCDAAVWALDADGLVVRPGPRLVDGVEALAGVLHPDVVGAPDPGAARRLR
ncbi:ABC transporter substrate-binding protein [Aquipuribacter nitratireducens]|uniref:ABC transporter substrate-binding protein n=1 Tax=Aquipuribacter nitratireducens TaxID=650104 RepID=A0ABW0GL18_9MICO